MVNCDVLLTHPLSGVTEYFTALHVWWRQRLAALQAANAAGVAAEAAADGAAEVVRVLASGSERGTGQVLSRKMCKSETSKSGVSEVKPKTARHEMWGYVKWTPSQPCFLTLLWQYLQVQQFVQALNDMGVLCHDHPSKPVKPSAMIMEAFQCRCTRRTQEGTGVDQVGRLSSSDFQWIQCKDGDWSFLVLK